MGQFAPFFLLIRNEILPKSRDIFIRRVSLVNTEFSVPTKSPGWSFIISDVRLVSVVKTPVYNRHARRRLF